MLSARRRAQCVEGAGFVFFGKPGDILKVRTY